LTLHDPLTNIASMAGQFAHILLVNSICTPEGLDLIPDLLPSVRSALQNYQPFCRLGAVSPDCPSVVGSTDATGWAGVMHYVRPADFVRRYGIPKLLQMPFNTAETRACIAWLFGYAAHLVTDLTVHPVVEALVGPYSNKKNRVPHRRCEMDQDAYIFTKLTGREVLDTDFLDFTGLAQCGVKGNTNKLNPAVLDFWRYCLQQYPREETREYVRLPSQSLNANVWFATYVNVMDHFATKSSLLVRWLGCDYRKSGAADPKYIEKLPVPGSSKRVRYEDLFEQTRKNLIQAWSELAKALKNDDANVFALKNGNLDTGKGGDGKYVCWA
jgi:Zinc dependent phospholipase C